MPRLVHFDISAEDPERALKFYKDVFGWKAEKWDGPFDYWMLITGPDSEPGINGGLAKMQGPKPGSMNVVDVPSVDEYIEKVKKHGGKIISPKNAIPGVGYISWVEDTEGIQLGIMESDEGAK